MITFDKDEFTEEFYDDDDSLCFDIADCYDEEGYFDEDLFEGAILDGEYVPEYWFG